MKQSCRNNLFQSWESKYKGRQQFPCLYVHYLPLTEGCFNGKDLEEIRKGQRATVLTSNPHKAQLELQDGKKKMATAFEPEFGNIKTINKKAKHTEIDYWFCGMCQKQFVGNMISCICSKRVES